MKYPIDGGWNEIMNYTLHAKRYEPVSIKGRIRRLNVGHRFEINVLGAKTAMQVMAENITANNSLLKRLLRR